MMKPSDYTPEKGARICEEIAAGRTIRQICKEKWSPSWPTIRKWIIDLPEFSTQYARAREASADDLEAEILDTARDPGADVAAARLKVDTLKWVAARRNPKAYGDKTQTEHTGQVIVNVDRF